MFDRDAGDHCIEEQRPGRSIDDGRACDAERVDIAARETRSHSRADMAVPNHVARARVEGIHVIRFGRDNDHRGTAGAVLAIQRLCVYAAQNRAVKVQLPPQIRGGRPGKSRIDVKPVARYMIVLLRDVHLRLTWNDNCPSGDHPENSKEKFHPSGAIGPARCCPATCSVIRMSRCERLHQNQRATRDSFLHDLVLGTITFTALGTKLISALVPTLILSPSRNSGMSLLDCTVT